MSLIPIYAFHFNPIKKALALRHFRFFKLYSFCIVDRLKQAKKNPPQLLKELDGFYDRPMTVFFTKKFEKSMLIGII